MPRRIHVVGGPGSGKSTLAHRLGAQLGLPVYPLDQIAFEPPHFMPRPRTRRLEEVHQIATQPRWITEGMFLGWTNELFDCADLIIWLDHVSWRVAFWRILVRFSKWGLETARRQPGARKINRFGDYARNTRQLLGVFGSSWRYYHEPAAPLPLRDWADTRTLTGRFLADHRDKVLHLERAGQLDALLGRFEKKSFASEPED